MAPKDRKELFLSVRKGQINQVQKLINSGRVAVDVRDDWDNTPLYLACLCRHKDVVRYLLEKGACFEADSEEGQRAFLAAIDQDIRELLKKHDAIKTTVAGATRDAVQKLDPYRKFLHGLWSRTPEADMTFQFPSSQGLKTVHGSEVQSAHKSILVARCPCLIDCISSNADRPIFVRDMMDLDVQPKTLECFLEYLYTAQTTFDVKSQGRELVEVFRKLRLEDTTLTNLVEQTFIKRKGSIRKKDEVVVSYGGNKMDVHQLKDNLQVLALGAIPPCFLPQVIPSFSSSEQFNIPNTFADVAFQIEGHLFLCHKIFFYGRSDYFKLILVDLFGELAPPTIGDYRPCIPLEAIKPHIFAQVVMYIYTDSCQLSGENIIPLLGASELYGLTGLQRKCVAEVGQYLTVANVAHTARVAKSMDNDRLMDTCTEYMGNNLLLLLENPDFQLLIRHVSEEMHAEEMDYNELLEDIAYAVRNKAKVSAEMAEANSTIDKFNQLLQQHGIPEITSKFDMTAASYRRSVSREATSDYYKPKKSKAKKAKKSDDSGCSIS